MKIFWDFFFFLEAPTNTVFTLSHHTSINPALHCALHARSFCFQWCLFSFCSHPCSAGCLYVSIRHVALAQHWRQRPVLHWVVPPSRSGCESEAWIRHPRLPTQYFLSRIENERRWWLRARCFRPCEWPGRAAVRMYCYWKSRDVIQDENLLLFCPGLTEPRRMTYPFSVIWISVISHLISNLSVHLHLSKKRPPVFYLFIFWAA